MRLTALRQWWRDAEPDDKRALARAVKSSVDALRHVVHAPARRMLAFRLPKEDAEMLSAAAEAWLLRCSERQFPTLAYYKNL